MCSECGPLQSSTCGEWNYDPDAGIPIAIVRIHSIIPKNANCGPQFEFAPDPPKAVCSIRPFVYRNPLLFELIRGCHIDLVQIDRLSKCWENWAIGNRAWANPIPWKDFAAEFNEDAEGFQVWFTKAVNGETLHEASVFLSAVI